MERRVEYGTMSILTRVPKLEPAMITTDIASQNNLQRRYHARLHASLG